MEKPGYLVARDRVITPEVIFHPRFIEKIEVKIGGKTIGAKVAAYAKYQNGLELVLSDSQHDGRPLTFDGTGAPAHIVSYDQANAQWTMTLSNFEPALAIREDGESFRMVKTTGVVTNRAGRPVGMVLTEKLPLNDSWRGSPLDWEKYNSAEMAELQQKTQAWADRSLLRVRLNFRSPAKSKSNRFMSFRDDSEKENATDLTCLGLLLDGSRIMVLNDLKPAVTARLEKITVYGADEKEYQAAFAGSLTDHSGFIAQLKEPVAGGGIELAGETLLEHADRILPCVDIRIQGQQRAVYTGYCRAQSFELGWRSQVYPDFERGSGEEVARFVFTPEGKLAAFPIAIRQKVADQERWYDNEAPITCASTMRPILSDPAVHYDRNNVPLNEQEETRLAWMGVVLQGLDEELAELNHVSEQTQNGQNGALVSYVYPGSPADRAGIKAGDILLRLFLEGQPKPFEIDLSESSMMDNFGEMFWEQIDDIPAEAFDDLPTPWPAADDMVSQALTNYGIGKPYRAEFYAEGKQAIKDFVAEPIPAYYNSAPKYKSDGLGLTVRDLTYEVRRYFQMEDAAPGIILSKIESGSKAEVAGLKVYEIITHVNDVEVKTVADFQKTIADQKELNLTVKRKMKGRVVKLSQ